MIIRIMHAMQVQAPTMHPHLYMHTCTCYCICSGGSRGLGGSTPQPFFFACQFENFYGPAFSRTLTPPPPLQEFPHGPALYGAWHIIYYNGSPVADQSWSSGGKILDLPLQSPPPQTPTKYWTTARFTSKAKLVLGL